MNAARQMGLDDFVAEREICAVRLSCVGWPAHNRRAPARLARARVVPSSGVDIVTPVEQGSKHPDLRRGRRPGIELWKGSDITIAEKGRAAGSELRSPPRRRSIDVVGARSDHLAKPRVLCPEKIDLALEVVP